MKNLKLHNFSFRECTEKFLSGKVTKKVLKLS